MRPSKSGIIIAIAIVAAVLVLPGSRRMFAQEQTSKGFVTEQGHIGFSVRVNGQPVRLIIDTGAEVSVLWRSAANRLKLKLTEPTPGEPRPGWVKGGITEEVELTVGDSVSPGQRFAVADLPLAVFRKGLCDGVFGWGHLKQHPVSINWDEELIEMGAEADPELEGWTAWRLSPEAKMAAIEVADGKVGGNVIEVVAVFLGREDVVATAGKRDQASSRSVGNSL